MLSIQPVQPEVVQDEQIGCQEGSEGAVCGVVDSGLSHGFEEAVGVSGADGGIAEHLGEEALADASGSHQQDVLVLVQEFQ